MPVLRQKIIVVGQFGLVLHDAPQLWAHALGLMQIGEILSICLIGGSAAVDASSEALMKCSSSHRRIGRNPHNQQYELFRRSIVKQSKEALKNAGKSLRRF